MKTSKEFFERLQTDEAFAKAIGDEIKAKAEAGETDYKKVIIPVAQDAGYEISGDKLDDMYEKMTTELSEEELGKVSGGVTPFFGFLASIIIFSSAVSITAEEILGD